MSSLSFTSKKLSLLISFILLLTLGFNTLLSYAQSDISSSATPLIRNYSPKEYQAHLINMTVKKDNNGILYFANVSGVLQFDGKNWRTIKVPNVQFVRSLDIDEEGTVFVGAINTIGMLKIDSIGSRAFVPLMNLIDEDKREFGEVWTIKATLKGVFFSTDKYIFRYYQGKITTWQTKEKYFYLVYDVYDDTYVLDSRVGLGRIEGDSLNIFYKKEDISGIQFMLPYTQKNEKEILVGLKQENFLIYNPKKDSFRIFKTELTQEEIQAVYSGIIGKDGNYYISMIRHGVVCLSPNEKKIFHVKKQNGLETNKVYAAELDNQGNLWLALGKGIAKVEIGSPFKKFDERDGLIGIVTAAKEYKDNSYVATTNGVYKYNEEKLLFEILQGTPYQSWKFEELPIQNDTLLILATNTGIQKVEQDKTVDLFKTDASVSHLVTSKNKESTLYVGLLNKKGVYKLSYSNKSLKPSFEQAIPNITTEGLELIDNTLFVLDNESKISVFEERDSLEKIDIDFNMKVNSIENHTNRLFLATDSILYLWQESSFKPYTVFNEKLPPNTNLTSIYSIDDEHIVLRTENVKQTLYYLFNTKTTSLQKLPTERLTDNKISIQGFFKIKEGLNKTKKLTIGTSEGLYYLDIENQNYKTAEFNVYIRKVIQAVDTLFVENYTEDNKNPILNYDQNSLTFFYSSNNSLDAQNTVFRYRLNGYEKKWSEWTTETKKEYTNLDAGKYSFEVEAKNIYDTKSEITKYNFKIKPPFYRTWGAYITYFVILSLFVWGVIKLNLKRLQRKNIKLEEIIAERTTELREKNEEVNIQNQKLETQQKLVESAYQNVSQLSEVGKQVTSSLSVERIIETVYGSVNKLLDASIFIIGIYNEKENCLDFINSKEKGKALPFHQTSLSGDNFPSYCFNKNEEIIINDVQKEYHNYFSNQELKALEGDMPESLIYVPIIYKDETIGVLTVQSFEKDSYTRNHLNLVRNIAVYAAIALVNAKSYQKIEEQSNAISLQNENIKSSINYASRIQRAMLPPVKNIKNAFGEAFVLWLPRDVVSGDFYWFAEIENKICIAAVDCTGHGVPGAFMSMIGNDMLNHIVLEKRITNPAEILTHLHQQVSTALRQSETQNRDGMDMVLCVYDKTTKELEFAGAKNPLYYIQNGELQSISGSKFPIGGKWGDERERIYENHGLKIEQKTTIFLCTDGYQDQFGGKKGKKLMKKKMKALFVEVADLEDNKQKEKLENYFLNWKKEEEQVDDVLVMGFKVG